MGNLPHGMVALSPKHPRGRMVICCTAMPDPSPVLAYGTPYDARPAGSRLMFSEDAEGFMILELPRSRLARDMLGLIVLALGGLVVAAVSIAGIVGTAAGAGRGGITSAFVIGAVGAGAVTGIALQIRHRIRLARQPGGAGVQSGQLVIITPGRRQTIRSTCDRDHVTSLKVRITGINLLFQLTGLLSLTLTVLHPRTGRSTTRHIRLFLGHRQNELLWAANHLRRALGLVEA